ncbi:MAG: hypothetical protein NTY39_00780 [Campylobacterales bacterium]|nr:hypothetical protein [Campylobacterales bacterium]
MTLFSDPKTGQVFTTPAADRVEMGDFIDAKTVDMADRDQESKFSEYLDGQKKFAKVKSKAKTLEFSGTHYFGLTSVSPERTGASVDNSMGFELRRNYVQVKAFINDKDFFRVTMDTTKEIGSGTSYANMYAKYAYLYLDKVLPYTGVEIGIAHRPWIDYEEHNSWHYRSINKVAIEQKTNATDSGPDLINSADLGFNLKTKMENFSSEIGMFNGEGYHADKLAANQENSKDLSLEWRLTAHILGDGTKLGKNDRTKATYANLSTYGLMSKNHKDNGVAVDDATEYDRSIYGVHAVYNQPAFLIAAQYYIAKDEAQNTVVTDGKEYKGWSVNAEVRPATDWTIIGRYDVSDIDKVAKGTGLKTKSQDMKQTLLGVAYKMNKNVTFIASGKHITDATETAVAATLDAVKEKNVYMLTTEVKW